MINKFLYILLTLIVLLLVAFQTEPVQQRMTSYISAKIESETGLRIKMKRIGFALPFRWVLRDVSIGDENGEWVTAAELRGRLSLRALKNNKVVFHHIYAEEVAIKSLPNRSNENGFGNASLLKDFEISRFKVSNLTIAPHLLGLNHPLPSEGLLSLQGSLLWQGREGLGEVKAALTSDLLKETTARIELKGIQKDDGISFTALWDITPLPEIMFLKGTFAGELDPLNRTVQIKDFTLDSDLLALKGAATITSDLHFENASCDITLHRQEGFIPRVSLKDFSIHCTLTGDLAMPKFEATMNSPLVTFNNTALGVLQGTLLLSGVSSDLQGKTSITLEGGVQPFQISGDFHFKIGESYQLSQATLLATNTKFDGTLSWNPDLAYLEGTLQGYCDDLSVLKDFVPKSLEGALKGDLLLYGKSNGKSQIQAIDADLIISSPLHYGDFAIAKGTVKGSLEDLFNEPQGKLVVKATQASFQRWKLSSFSLETSAAKDTTLWPFEIKASGDYPYGWTINADGHWHHSLESLLLQFDAFEGDFAGHPFSIQYPVIFNHAPGKLDMSPLSLGWDNGTAYASFAYSQEEMHITTRLKDIPLEIIRWVHPHFPLEGKFVLDAYLFGPAANLKGQADLMLNDIKVKDDPTFKLQNLQVSCHATLTDGGLDGSATCIGLSSDPIRIDAKLPLKIFAEAPFINIDMEAPISGLLTASGEIAPVIQLFVDEPLSLAAKVALNMRIAGNLTKPQLHGGAELLDGSFESMDSGAVFPHMSGTFIAEGTQLKLINFRVQDHRDGMIQGLGSLDLDWTRHFPFTLDLEVNRAKVVNLDVATAYASGKVTLKGDFTRGALEGKLLVDDIRVMIPERPGVLTKTVDVTYINLPRSEVSPIFYTQKSSTWLLDLAVQLELNHNGTIKGTNFISEWRGSVFAGGTDESPELSGELKLIKGQYLFNGKAFDLSQGKITFAGDPTKKTSLYVIANRDLGKIIAEIILKGPVTHPSLVFRSNPPLPQREILSWILFNRGSAEINPFQGAQLNESITDLGSSGEGPDLLTKIRQSIGIDQIDINRSTNGETNDVSLQVGKYITKGILLKINKSISTEANRAGIEANLMQNIKIEAEVGDDAAGQLKLKWKRDY